MPLTTNNCRKHGGHVEEECPECVQEAYANNLDVSREFMRKYGRVILFETTELNSRKRTPVRIEDLFETFRALIIEELNGG